MSRSISSVGTLSSARCPNDSHRFSVIGTNSRRQPASGTILTRALEQSAFQLVICSRKAAQSRWVNEEIKTYKRLGREQRIFALIVDGEPGSPDQECFPEALSFRMGADGQLTRERTEPIAADGRPGKDSKLDVKLKLIAGMLGVGLDELKRREAHRRQRRLMWLAAASVTGMAITSTLAGAAWFARNEAERQRVRAESEAETARQTTRFMLDLFKVSDPSEALGNSITAREILDKGAARIDRELAGQPAIQATLMDTMGTVYTSLGLYDAADPTGPQGVHASRKALGHVAPGSGQQPQPSRRGADAQVGLRGSRAEAAPGARNPHASARQGQRGSCRDARTAGAGTGEQRRVCAGRAADPRGAANTAEALRQEGRTRTSRKASRSWDSIITSGASTTRRSRSCATRWPCRKSCTPRRIRRWRNRSTTSPTRWSNWASSTKPSH